MAYRLMAGPLCGVLTAFGGHRDRVVRGRRAPVAVATAIVLIGVGCLAACSANARSASSSQPPSAPETGPTRSSIGAALPSPAIAGLLTGVSAGPGGTAWAVGASCTSSCEEPHPGNPLILRWTGVAWSQVPSPAPGGRAALVSVAAGPGGSAWAVGGSCASGCGTAAGTNRTLILRWTGGAWSQVPSPSPGVSAILGGVGAGPGGSAWAVGGSCVSGCGTAAETDRTLILRWTGGAWSQVPSPSPGVSARLSAVAAGPGGSAWAVGYSCAVSCGTTPFRSGRTLILRWNGSAWSAVPTPRISGGAILGGGAILDGVTAGPGGTAWAVGAICASACGTVSETHRTLILQWTGGAWSQVPSPTPGGDAVLFGTNVGPGGSAWAVGFSCVSVCDPASETDRTLILRWTGGAWLAVPAPSWGSEAFLYGVSAGPGGSAWAVGFTCVSGCTTASPIFRTVILRWTGTSWSAGR
jgi:hypothetical protein